MAERLKVTHLVLSLDVGGLEHVVLDLAREGRRLGQRVEVLCLERPGTLAARAGEMGVPVYCVHKRPGLRLGCTGRVKALLRERRPDVVHTHQIGALFYGGPAARRAGVPVVVHTEHGKHYARRRTCWLGWLAGRHAARFVCVSRDIADDVLAHRIVPRRKVVVVPNGIDTDRFRAARDDGTLRRELGIPAEAPVIGTVGRLTEVKRQDLLLRAFARVRQQLPAAHLLLVGDGPLRAGLHRLAGELGLEGRVHFAGYQAEPERYLALLSAFALTSRSEGMPLAVLEAWAAGVPVVASRVGGLAELIEDGHTGLLFDRDDEAALAGALLQVLGQGRLAGELREAGRQKVEDAFSRRRMADTYQGHYLQVLSRAGAVCGFS
jgi:glycosyltransferase involved in cell wall biosynthesis